MKTLTKDYLAKEYNLSRTVVRPARVLKAMRRVMQETVRLLTAVYVVHLISHLVSKDENTC